MFPYRRVCYANESMVSLTQEKQLADASAQFSNGLKPSEVSATTKEEKA